MIKFIWHCLLINKNDAIFYRTKNKNGFLSFARNLSNKYKKQLLDTGLNSLKTASKNVVRKTGEFLGNKIAGAVTNS